ncbi:MULTISPECIES: flagellar biosynthetic protein FliO [Caldimonas]|uniref:FliO/MopB family protein n=1 Tax=Caldimonas TaxID=196013 RepID=UPI00037ABA27|nr:flagellar biosynthetic protein FliO [Caldimonas manganoxidans]MCX7660408.1 flagellar biosynthetic protein FliO [Caldimonas manganoxidans]
MSGNGSLPLLPMPTAGSFLLWFLLIVAAIPLTLWFLKRSPLGSLGQTQTTRIISSTPVGPAQRLVTVEVGHGDERRWLILGVTAQSIRTLHTLPAQDLPQAPPAPQAPAFASLFHTMRKDR